MKTIKTTNGFEFLVDDEDFDYLNNYSWYALPEKRSRNKRVADSWKKINGNRRMHRVIMNCPKGMTVDHINGDTQDNRKSNLRVCTAVENNRNKPKKQGKFTSQYVGVSWNSKCKKWYACIKKNEKSYNLGHYDNEMDAAKAYDKKALEFFKEFANINFKQERKAG